MSAKTIFFKNTYLMISILIIVGVFLFLIYTISFNKIEPKEIIVPQKNEKSWQVKSIDTMKYSRDLSLEKINDSTFDVEIDSQLKAIKNLNANYVAIATPYDAKFVPILTRWVEAARRYKLHVWFRGNFSGWEGWFGESRSLSRESHSSSTREFIQNNPNLFMDGDIFSPCPECENGGPGDPRINGDVAGFRKFMIDEHNVSDQEFKKIHKKVATNFSSMNYDVASLVMDRDTVSAMGGLIVIDHYVSTPQKLYDTIDSLHQTTNARIFLGETGTPIPDITGQQTPDQQAAWMNDALNVVSKKPFVIGINYWVIVGGETALISDDKTPKPIAAIVKKYFSLTNFN